MENSRQKHNEWKYAPQSTIGLATKHKNNRWLSKTEKSIFNYKARRPSIWNYNELKAIMSNRLWGAYWVLYTNHDISY